MFLWCRFDHSDITINFNQFLVLSFPPTLNDLGMDDPVRLLLLNCDVCFISIQ
jgi:hypothetical protein